MPDVVPVKIRAIKRVTAQPVYDIQVKKNHNFFANGLLVHNCVIFQEQVMELAEKCAGFPKDKCDDVRRAIMKLIGAAAEEAQAAIKKPFVEGCIANGYTEQVANHLFSRILFFAGYGFNSAHAVSYAIDSYWCAWLLTYHEEQWVCAYLESMMGSPENKAEALGYVKALGYQVVPLDATLASTSWQVLPGKRLMPSLLSCKAVGATAIEELESFRPLTTIEDLLYNEDGTWRPSKFNKKALEALVQVRALDGLNCVGEGKLFSSYRHMHHVLFGSHVESVTKKRKGIESTEDVVIEHSNLIKRAPTKDPQEGRRNMYELARSTREEYAEEWSRRELVAMQAEAFGSADLTAIFEPSIFDKLDEKGIKSIEQLEEGQTALVWAITVAAAPKKGMAPVAGIIKKTRTGKSYVQAFVTGVVGKPIRLNVWSASKPPEPYKLCLIEAKRDSFGTSTVQWKVKELA